MRDEDKQKLAKFTVDCALALFETCALTPQYEGHEGHGEHEQAPKQATVAVLGFTSDSARGSIVVCARESFFSRSCPQTITTEAELRDWAGEISNQLLGRIKNRLWQCGLDIHMSTPTTLVAECIRFGRTDSSQVHYFRCGEERVLVQLDLHCDPDFVFADPTNAPSVAAEGALLMF